MIWALMGLFVLRDLFGMTGTIIGVILLAGVTIWEIRGMEDDRGDPEILL